jgi:hypothetical protein
VARDELPAVLKKLALNGILWRFYAMHIARMTLKRILAHHFLFYLKTFFSRLHIGTHLKDTENVEQEWSFVFY